METNKLKEPFYFIKGKGLDRVDWRVTTANGELMRGVQSIDIHADAYGSIYAILKIVNVDIDVELNKDQVAITKDAREDE